MKRPGNLKKSDVPGDARGMGPEQFDRRINVNTNNVEGITGAHMWLFLTVYR